MANDVQRLTVEKDGFTNDSGNANLIKEPVIGVVRSTIDSNRTGTIKVFIARLGKGNPDTEKSWIDAKYMSPFYGYTPGNNGPTGYGDFTANPHAYGFWANPPDVGTEVVCIFVNGNISQCYYIGCVPRAGYTYMVPAIASAPSIVPNKGEAAVYGAAKRLPATEITTENAQVTLNPQFFNQPKPVHTYQAGILDKQGLLTDRIRGTIGSSSQRESPSAVFGISTPGRPIYSGGLSDKQAGATASIQPASKLQVIGRRGGHSIVMDDGDVNGADQLIRIRTAQGHQITMSDDGQTLFIVHSNGQSYIELGKEGTVDIYSTNSFNVRTQGDINLHADRDINMHAKRNINMFAEQNISTQAQKNINTTAVKDHINVTGGKHTIKASQAFAASAAGSASLESTGVAIVKGTTLFLNTIPSPVQPSVAPPMTKYIHADTKFTNKSFISTPGALQSITTRTPTHTPWAEAGKGVAIKVSISADGASAIPTPALNAGNQAASKTPLAQTSASAAASVPPTESAGVLDANTARTVISQQQAQAQPAVKQITQNNNGVAAGLFNGQAYVSQFAQPISQLEQTGFLKPGAAAIASRTSQLTGNVLNSIPNTLWTGKNGVTGLTSYLASAPSQVLSMGTSLAQSSVGLVAKGIFTGLESPSMLAGSVLSGAMNGVENTAKYFVNSVTGPGSPVGGIVGGITNVFQAQNPITSSVINIPSLVSGGNFAGILADRATSGLTGLVTGAPQALLNQFNGLQGSAVIALQNQLGQIPNLVPGLPANLVTGVFGNSFTSLNSITGNAFSAINTGLGNIGTELTAGLGNAFSEVSGSIGNIAGDLGNTLADLGSELKGDIAGVFENLDIPGVSDLTAALSDSALGQAFSEWTSGFSSGGLGSVADIGSLGGISSFAGPISGAIGAFGDVGGSSLQPAPIATNTVDLGPISAQTERLYADSGGPVAAVDFDYQEIPPTPVDLETNTPIDNIRSKTQVAQQRVSDLQTQISDLQGELALNPTNSQLKSQIAVLEKQESTLQAQLDTLATRLLNAFG